MKFRIHRIIGESMSPTLNEGDYALSLLTRKATYQKGDVVIVKHREFQVIIKRIVDIRANGDIYLGGDNPQSTPSEILGWQPKSSIIGKMKIHIPFSKNKYF